MNILYLCDEYPPCAHGGIGTATKILAEEMARCGHNVIICGFYPYFRKALAYEKNIGVTIYRKHYGSWLLLKISKHKLLGHIFNIKNQFLKYSDFVINLIEKYKIDIVEGPDFNEAFRYSGPQMLEYPRFKIPYFVKIHGSYSFLSGFPGSISFDAKIYANERNNLLKADTLIAVSEFAKRKLFEVYNYPFEIHVINNGVPIYDHVESDKAPESNTVIFAGTFSEQKGILNLIKAWKNVVKEIAGATLVIYGRGGQKFKRKMFNAISDDAKGTIIINGFVERDELLAAYAKAGCAIFPSFFETCGMAVLEAMQVGCPTIFTKNASGQELINDGYNGLLVNPDDILEIADKIIFLLKNRDYARRIGQNGANTVKLKFDISKVCKSHLELYKEVLNNKSA